MTREEMNKRHFNPYMKLVINDFYGEIESILIAVDFDMEVFTLRPLDIEKYQEEDVTVSISKVSFPKRKMELIQSK